MQVNYAYMQHDYVDMRLIRVNMEVNDVTMEDIYGDMQVNFVGMRLLNVNTRVMNILPFKISMSTCKLSSMLL